MLNTNALATSFAAAAALLWTLCSLAVMALPGAMMNMSGHMVHADFSGMAWVMTISGYLVGLVLWGAVAAAFGGLVALVYNKMAA